MNLREIVDLLGAEVLTGNELIDEIEVEHCFCADLMSDVLGRTHANDILITGLTNPQAVRTADIAEIKAVCFVSGKRPEPDSVALAKQKDIPLLMTKLTMFEASGVLYMKGLRGAAERQ